MLREHLALAEKHIAEGLDIIARQRGVIARLAENDADPKLAREILGVMERTQELHLADRERLLLLIENAS